MRNETNVRLKKSSDMIFSNILDGNNDIIKVDKSLSDISRPINDGDQSWIGKENSFEKMLVTEYSKKQMTLSDKNSLLINDDIFENSIKSSNVWKPNCIDNESAMFLSPNIEKLSKILGNNIFMSKESENNDPYFCNSTKSNKLQSKIYSSSSKTNKTDSKSTDELKISLNLM